MNRPPLKCATGGVIKDKSKQMQRWVDHYSELYSGMNIVSEEALITMESLSTMDELDSGPTLEEINQALDQFCSGKPHGNDGIPAEVIKCAKEHSSRNYMRYFANAGEKVRFYRT